MHYWFFSNKSLNILYKKKRFIKLHRNTKQSEKIWRNLRKIMNSLKRKNKANEEITSQRTKVNAEERTSEELRKGKKTLITKVAAGNKVAAVAPQATYEIFNRLRRCVQKYQQATRLERPTVLFCTLLCAFKRTLLNEIYFDSAWRGVGRNPRISILAQKIWEGTTKWLDMLNSYVLSKISTCAPTFFQTSIQKYFSTRAVSERINFFYRNKSI